MKIIKLFIYAFIILLFSNIICAIGISPSKRYFDFEPNTKLELQSIILNNAGQDIIATISARGVLANYTKLDQDEVAIPKDGRAIISFTINLPDTLKPGINELRILATENYPTTGGGIVAVTAVDCVVRIRVPYPGKYIEATLSAPNVAINDPIPFTITVTSRGDYVINKIYALIDVFLDEKKIKSLTTNPINNLPPKEINTLKAVFDSKGQSIGKYKAKATIFYDQEQMDLETSFRIGERSLRIIDYTNEVYKGKINEFNVEVENLWNDKIDNVYAEIIVDKDKLKTPTIDNIGAWQKAKLTTYWNTRDISTGSHDIKIIVYYAGGKVEEDGIVYVLEYEEPEKLSPQFFNATIIFIIVIALLVIIDIIFLLKKRKHK